MWTKGTWKSALRHQSSGRYKLKQWDHLITQRHPKEQQPVLMWLQRERESPSLLLGMSTRPTFLENNMDILQRIINGASIWPTTGNIPWGPKNTAEISSALLCCSTIYDIQNLEANWVPKNRRLTKQTMEHLHNRIHIAVRKKWTNGICL